MSIRAAKAIGLAGPTAWSEIIPESADESAPPGIDIKSTFWERFMHFSFHLLRISEQFNHSMQEWLDEHQP